MRQKMANFVDVKKNATYDLSTNSQVKSCKLTSVHPPLSYLGLSR